MNIDVENSIISLLTRIPTIGRKATFEEISSINQDCGGIVPEWYSEILLSYPICGLELGWQLFEPEEDFDGIEWVEWSNPKMMKAEMLEGYPGDIIYKHGYLNVASRLDGDANPYFINVNEGENPRVLKVYHDVSQEYEIILKQGTDVVSEKLSDFFYNVKAQGI